ncbi:MAG: HflC protein [Gammaproteobacteria bacterium]|nr:HflC protein [Gammaproteobacteria bacterium]MBJ40139.1 HflC protein [Gammaproteobacteria bacterium]|tara:strand:+ start:4629 stop:5498 length:870 start_codon:yes stop_codon:yes gene_type:complete
MSVKTIVAVIAGALILLLGANSLFVVSEFERAVLLKFGAVARADVPPGMHIKLPFVEEVRRFDARVLTLDAPAERFLTLEKKAVMVDSFAKFRVTDVEKYYTSTSGDENRAKDLLKQRVNTGLRNEISKRSLHEVVSGERDQLMTILTKNLDFVAKTELGVEVVDVRVKRIDLPDEVSESVYNRMNTEREIEAAEHRAKGKELAVGIRADADRQEVVILAEAYRDAERIRGSGDAEAAGIYAAAYNRDPEFYRFYRSMAAYRETFASKGDVLLVQPDSDFFNYMSKIEN